MDVSRLDIAAGVAQGHEVHLHPRSKASEPAFRDQARSGLHPGPREGYQSLPTQAHGERLQPLSEAQSG